MSLNAPSRTVHSSSYRFASSSTDSFQPSALSQSLPPAVSAVKEWVGHKGNINSESLKPIWDRARLLFRALGPFISINHALVYGKPRNISNELLELYMDQMDITDVHQAERDIASLQELRVRILKLVPNVDDDISHYEADSKALDALSVLLDTGARAARRDDISTLRSRVMMYLLASSADDTPPGVEPIRVDTDKTGYGWNHPQSGRMLCPAELLKNFDEDPPAFCRKVREGKIVIRGDDFPIFLYENYSYDPNNAVKGLLRGELLVQAARGLFTGPRAARKKTKGRPDSNGRSSVADIYHLRKITPQTIGYVAVLVRFVLSSAMSWTDKAVDGAFRYRRFFDEIIGLFADSSDPWGTETLQHWKDWVFDGEGGDDEEPQPSHETVAMKIAKQRAARLADCAPY